MHRLAPRFITDQYQAGESSGTFPAVGLFVDLSGFTNMTNSLMRLGQHGAEILAAIMRQVFDPMINSIYQHGGFVSTFSGDAFTSLFPVTSGMETACLNALTSAIEMQQFIAQLPAHSTPAGDFNLSVRIGLASGDVDWGIIDSRAHQRAAYYFRGSTVEGCIASENNASKGEIILDDETRQLLGPQLKLEPLERHFRLLEAPAVLAEKTPLPEVVDNLAVSRLFYPEEILTQSQSGEFRQIVNLFISLPTIRTREQLEIFMHSLFDLQQRYGGFLNRLDFGDKGAHLLLFWGAPVTHENDIGRALNFILELQAETAIPIKAGATYRIAHAGFIGNQLREEYTCYGEGVNLAARFMTEADRGEIWICNRIARRVKNHFVLDSVGERLFKGFENPEVVYALIEREETVSRLFTSPFIGREQELTALMNAAAPLWQGIPADPVVLVGEPGIGKSRLVHEFRSQITASGKEIFWARCQSDQVLRSSFNPIRYWLKNYFEVNDSQPDARNKRNFNRKLDSLISRTRKDRLAATLDRTRSFIGNLINLDWADSLYHQVDPQSRYENTIAGLIALLQAESQDNPLILVLEDIQWLDIETLDLLTRLHQSIRRADNTGLPIMILATARELPPSIQGKGTFTFHEIRLSNLLPGEIERLAGEILEGHLNVDFSSWIRWIAEGNPYFLEQILYYLWDQGSISPTDNGWSVAETSPNFLPTDLRAILLSRLDQLQPEVKTLVQTASILGREFHFPLLREILGDGPALDSNLEAAQQSFLITQVSDHQYIFQSNLLRETAYQMQAIAQRRKMHAAAVEALNTLYREDRSNVYPELAFHAEQAGLIQTAIDYLEKAGISAKENYANQQAIEFISRAILLKEDVKNEQFLNLVLQREALHSLMGNRQEQINDLRMADRAAKTLSSPDLMAAVSNRLAFYYSQVGDYLNTIRFSQEAIGIAQQAGSVEIEVDARNNWAIASRHQGEYEHALAQSTYGLKLALKAEDPDGICLSLNSLSLTAIEQGHFDQAAAYLEESLVTAREAGNVNFQAQTLNNLGNIYGELGDFSSAFQAYSQALEIAQTIGNRMGEGLVSTNLGWIAGLLGNYPEAESYLELSIQIAKEIGDVYNQAFSHVNLCLFKSSQQKFKEARTHGEIALKILRQVGHKPGEAVAHTYLGHVFLSQKGYEMARNCYQDALQLRDELGQNNLAIEPLAGIAEITLQTSSPGEALQAAEPIFSYLGQGGALDGIDQPFRIYTTCVRILQANRHPDTTSFINTAYQVLQKQAEKIKDKNARNSFLEFVPCHQEMVRLFNESRNSPEAEVE